MSQGLPLRVPERPPFEDLEAWAGAEEPSEAGAYFVMIQAAEHILHAVQERDPRTGKALPRPLRELLQAAAREATGALRPVPEDRLMQALRMGLAPLKQVLLRHRTRIMRDHQKLPLHRLREVDSASVAWLARQPGRTVREKLAGQGRALGVLRRVRADTVENQAARALCALIGQRAEDRLAWIDRYDHRPLDEERRALLEEALRVCTVKLRGSDLADVPIVTSLRPNNALLGDRRYARIYRALKWLRAQEEDMARAWDQGQIYVERALFLLLCAWLANQGCVQLCDGMAQIEEGRLGEPGMERLLTLPQPRWERLHLALLVRSEGGVHRVHVRSEDEGLAIGLAPLLGGDLRTATSEETVRCRIRRGDAPLLPRRGPGLLIEVDRKGLGPHEAPGDVQGMWTLAEGLGRDILLLCSARSSSVPARHRGQPDGERLGLDLCAPRITIADGKAIRPLRTRGWAARHVWPEGEDHAEWLEGDAGRCLELHAKVPAIVALGAAVPGDEADEVAPAWISQAAHRISHSIAGELPSAARARVAYVVPDRADENTRRTLHGALASELRAAFPVWRSVAAAMGWQRDPNAGDVPFERAGVEPGDVLLVVDAEAPALTVTLLYARRAERLAERCPWTQGIYWERRPNPPQGECDEFLAYGALLSSWARDLLKPRASSLGSTRLDRLARNLVRTGLAEDLRSTAEPLWLPLDPGWTQALSLRSSDKRWEECLERYWQTFDEAIKGIRDLLRACPKGAGTHVLLVGRPFSQAKTARARLAKGLDRPGLVGVRIAVVGPDAPVRGAQDCLVRHEEGCQTWTEWSPDVRLEVIDEGLFEELVLLDEKLIDDPFLGDKEQRDAGVILPCDHPHFTLPLVVDGRSRRPQIHEARVECADLPLSEERAATLRLSYRHGIEGSYDLSLESPGLGLRRRWIDAESQHEAVLPEGKVADILEALRGWSGSSNGSVIPGGDRLLEDLDAVPARNGAEEEAARRYKTLLDQLGEQLGDGRNGHERYLKKLLDLLRRFTSPLEWRPDLSARALRALSAALWRDSRLVSALRGVQEDAGAFLILQSRRSLSNLFERVPREFEAGKDPIAIKNLYGHPYRDVCELLLALLRDPDLAVLLRQGWHTAQIARHVRLLDGIFGRGQIRLRWRVQQEVRAILEQSEHLHRMSWVPYALHVLLTGELVPLRVLPAASRS